MKSGQQNKPEPEPDLANLSQEELASNQAGTVIPWFVGERKIAVTWVSPVMNVFSRETDSATKK